MGPWDAVGHIIVGLWQTKKLMQAFNVTVSIAATACTSFLSGCGLQLYHYHAPLLVAIGYGMLTSSAALTALWTISPVLRGTALATFRPMSSDPAKLPDLSDFQVTERK